MLKLTLAASMTVFAIAIAAHEARADMPMMDEPISIAIYPPNGCTKKNCIAAEVAAEDKDKPARAKKARR
jgi:hypothetical protein